MLITQSVSKPITFLLNSYGKTIDITSIKEVVLVHAAVGVKSLTKKVFFGLMYFSVANCINLISYHWLTISLVGIFFLSNVLINTSFAL